MRGPDSHTSVSLMSPNFAILSLHLMHIVKGGGVGLDADANVQEKFCGGCSNFIICGAVMQRR